MTRLCRGAVAFLLEAGRLDLSQVIAEIRRTER